jgi:oxygen-dependent protoporphyrinogen oxidase
VTSKWPHLAGDGLVVLRASAGRIGDERAMQLDDATLVDRIHAELAEAMGLRDPPTASLVTRWPRALPQYEPGHQARVVRIEAALAGADPPLLLAGAAYRGLGIAACVQQAEQAATEAAARVARAYHRQHG